jgi:hypothetical protein
VDQDSAVASKRLLATFSPRGVDGIAEHTALDIRGVDASNRRRHFIGSRWACRFKGFLVRCSPRKQGLDPLGGQVEVCENK